MPIRPLRAGRQVDFDAAPLASHPESDKLLTMGSEPIRYDLMVQDALRGVVRKVLGDAAREGLGGEHHFYVSFKTTAAGVRLSNRLREQYPEEMTIVLQHQFWDLGVTEHTFEVGLSFGGVPERLLVPFEAITGFFDPSVQFGLKFEVIEPDTTAENDDKPSTTLAAKRPQLAALPPQRPAGGLLSAERKSGQAKELSTRDASTKDLSTKDLSTKDLSTKDLPAKLPAKPAPPPAVAAKPKAERKPAGKAERPVRETADKADDASANGAEVLSLDAFRKKK